MIQISIKIGQVFLPCITLVVMASGCSRSAQDSPGTALATSPKQAATQLQQAFVSTKDTEVKTAATTASEALRAADYERAMQALATIKAKKDLTVEQTMAVHESEAAMEIRLIQAMDAGDPKAKLAYEQLKKRRRN